MIVREGKGDCYHVAAWRYTYLIGVTLLLVALSFWAGMAVQRGEHQRLADESIAGGCAEAYEQGYAEGRAEALKDIGESDGEIIYGPDGLKRIEIKGAPANGH